MKQAALAKPGIGPADLLRLLAVAPRDSLTLDHDRQGWYGYVRVIPESDAKPDQVFSLPAPAPVEPASSPAAPNLKLETQYGIVERQSKVPDQAPNQAASQPPVLPLVPGDARVRPVFDACVVRDEDLIPRARLLPALRTWLADARPGAVDLPRLVTAAARLKLPRHLPRRTRQRWHPDLTLLFDYSEALWPYRYDMLRLKAWMTEECGRNGLRVAYCRNGPPAARWSQPRPGGRLLIVGDLGQLHPPAGPAAWGEFIARMHAAGVEVLALVPLGAGQLVPELLPQSAAGRARGVTQLRWSPDAPLRPQRWAAPAPPSGLNDLLAQCAALRRVDPALLRALRRMNPAAPLDAGLEGALWCHADVAAGGAADLNGPAGDKHRLRFAALPDELQRQTQQLAEHHHGHLARVVHYEETLLLAAHGSAELRSELEPDIREALDFLRALVPSLAAQPDGPWRSVVAGLLARADAAILAMEGLDALLHALAAACYRPGDAVPAWADVGRLPPGSGAMADYWLVEDGRGLWLSPRPPEPRQSAYGAPLTADRLLLRQPGERRGLLLPLSGRPLLLLSREQMPPPMLPPMLPQVATQKTANKACLHLASPDEDLSLGPIRRPLGVIGWGRDQQGLVVHLAAMAGHQVSFSAADLSAVPAAADDPDQRAHLQAGPVIVWQTKTASLSFGLDAPYGAYVELKLRGAVQRFRWLPAGTFLMGSPEDEEGRFDNEGPQHEVTLSGFWLADTACTQALWQAVMGNNPSHFKASLQQPVDFVSWEDGREFFAKLNALVPGLAMDFPTEAQWEYACRAGTKTAYSFGAKFDDKLANVGDKTVAVASLPANRWGLFEMHGNLFEWCADWYAPYAAEPQTDPEGPSQGTGRVLRGGSWILGARIVRSAFRYDVVPGFRFQDIGLRLAPGRAGPAEPAGGRAGRAPAKARQRDLFDEMTQPAEQAEKGFIRRFVEKLRGKDR